VIVRRPMRLIRNPAFLVVRAREVAPQSPTPWYQHGLIRKPLRKIGVILLHDVEHRCLAKPAMILGK
jgi:hypothetical protein